MFFAAATVSMSRHVSGAHELRDADDRTAREVIEQPGSRDRVLYLLVVRYHDDDDLGMGAHLRRRKTGLHAVSERPLHGIDVHVEAHDLEAFADQVPRHLQAHGAQPDHAGAGHRVARVIHAHRFALSALSCARRACVAARSSAHACPACPSTTPYARSAAPFETTPSSHVGQHALGIARERIAVAAAARRIEPEDVALLAADSRHSASAGAWLAPCPD